MSKLPGKKAPIQVVSYSELKKRDASLQEEIALLNRQLASLKSDLTAEAAISRKTISSLEVRIDQLQEQARVQSADADAMKGDLRTSQLEKDQIEKRLFAEGIDPITFTRISPEEIAELERSEEALATIEGIEDEARQMLQEAVGMQSEMTRLRNWVCQQFPVAGQ